MKARSAGYSHREQGILVGKVAAALGDMAMRYWINWPTSDFIELVRKSNRAISVRFSVDDVFAATDDGSRPWSVADGFRQKAVDAINAKLAEYRNGR